jgi:hypothetical protein
VRGNYIHGIGGTTDLLNHGVYADTFAESWHIAYNVITGITGGTGIQCNDNQGYVGQTIPVVGTTWLGFTDFRIYNNWIDGTAKYGINFNDQGSAGGTYTAHVYNNVVLRTASSPLRYTIGPATSHAEIVWAHNTVYDCVSVSDGSYFQSGWGAPDTGNVQLIDNIFAIGPSTGANVSWLYLNTGGSWLVADKNIWWGNTQSPTAVTADANRITTSPQFTDAANNDYSLGASSPAFNAGTETLPYSLTVTCDLKSLSRPQGAYRDLGALERAA